MGATWRAGCVLLFATALIATACRTQPEWNEHVLDSLPDMPGAKQVSVESEKGREVPTYSTTALYEAAPGATADEVIDFFVSEMKDDWCYKTETVYAYENGAFVDGEARTAYFQGDGSEIVLSTHRMFSGSVAFTIAVGPAYENDPLISRCAR
jgi:hypothetical protein